MLRDLSFSRFWRSFFLKNSLTDVCLVFLEKKSFPAGNYMFKVAVYYSSKILDVWRSSSVFIVNFEHISHLVLEFLLLTLNR